MNRRALFLVTSSPCASPRPAEAVRIAAGIDAWRQIDVRVFLHEPVVRALADPAANIHDAAQFQQCLPLLATSERPLLVPASISLPQDPDLWPWPTQGVTDRELASFAANATFVLRF